MIPHVRTTFATRTDASMSIVGTSDRPGCWHILPNIRNRSPFYFHLSLLTDNQTAKYYRFEFSSKVYGTAHAYQEMLWDIVRKKSEANTPFQPVPKQEITTE